MADIIALEKTLKVHRGHALEDLICAFEDPAVDPTSQTIKVIMILPNEQEEGAAS